MKKLLTLVLLLCCCAAASAATNNYNIGDHTSITDGSFTDSTLAGTTTISGVSASTLIGLNASKQIINYAGTNCTNQALYSLSIAGAGSCTSTFVGGGHTAMTSLGLRSTGSGAFDLALANTENLTAARTLTLRLLDASRTLTIPGSTTVPIASQTITLTGPSAARTYTLPDASVTLADLTSVQALTNKSYNGNTWTAGSGILSIAASKTLTASNSVTLSGTDGSTVAFGTGGTIRYTGAGTISLTEIAAQATNTLVGNATSGSASPTALAVGSCSAAGSALKWTTNSGFSCGTTFLVDGGALGTPSSGLLSNATGLPISTGLTGAGTGVLTALGVNVGSAGAPVLFNGAGGTPSSIVLTNATGTASALTAGTASAVAVGGITGLGTGVGTALAVNVGSAGAPVLFNGAGGTPSSITLTNATGTAASLTAGTASAVAVGGITGLGTGVATALAVNTGSAGAPVLFNGAGGTPSSITLTNATGTAASLTAGTASAVAVGGVTGLGTGVATFLVTPSSANLASAVTDEIGTGSVLFGSEGTWTPTILIGGVQPTSYETRGASYTKIGNRMCINARVQILVVGSATGSVQIGGLPATSNATAYNVTPMSILAFGLTGLTTESLQANLTNSSAAVDIFTFALGTVTALPHTKLAADAGFHISGCYPL